MRISKFYPFDDPESPCSKKSISAPLVFDLIGPFVVQFQQATKEHVSQGIICAPLCVDHHANILTDNNDISLNGLPGPAPTCAYSEGYVYRFAEGHAPTGAITFVPPNSRTILRVQYDQNPSCRLNPDEIAKKCHLVMVVPMPDRIVALRPEFIWIHRNGADSGLWVIDKDEKVKKYLGQAAADDIVNSSRGRGLRLIYSNCDQPPIFDSQGPGSPADFSSLCALTRGFPVSSEDGADVPPYYSMTLRFAAAHATTSEALDDAYTCFQSMRALFDSKTGPSAFSQWRVDFAHPLDTSQMGIEVVGGLHPHDCGSAVLAMQDWKDSTTSKPKAKR
jgi:hypothetical protein